MKPRIAIVLLTLLGVVCATGPAAAQGYGESPYIFGVHDPEGAPHMADKRKGWILFTEELGRDPMNASGRDYRPWADQGFGIIVRLNHGYGPTNGTLPYAKHYAAFAQRAARFVGASPGAHIWIVGNEMNWDQEWPRYEGTTEEITPDRYVQAFRQVRSAIKALSGHAADQVIPGALGTYGPPTAGGLSFVQYHVRVLELLGSGGLDAIAVHTYTHGTDPALVVDEAHMGPPYEAYHYNFRAYRDYLNAHPAWARSLPVYITETDQVGPWEDANRGWVRAAYREIDEWNRGAGQQKIRSLLLYRFCCDQWDITRKGGVIADFRQALDNDYRWTVAAGTALDADVVDNESAVGMSFAPGETRAVRVRVRNTGTSTWNAADGVRLGTANDNNLPWSAFACGGYANGVADGRAFLCRSVAPGESHDFTFSVTAPAAGTARLSVRMVKDGVAWFGEPLAWTLPVISSPPLAAQVLDSTSVPAAMAPGETRPVVVRVRNTGSTTWTAGELHRLGTAAGNSVTWSGFACDGFARNPGDARAYLCLSVPPGGTAEFAFNVTAPASGPAVLGVQMVRELVSWFGDARSFPIQQSANPCLTSVPADHWKGEYFPNTTLSGAPALVRDEAAASLVLSWGLGGPNTCGIGSDRFSARFTRTLDLSAGRYRFTARSDDGVRVWIDGQLLLDKWIVQAPTSYSFEASLAAGSHVVRVEYFENDGEAVAQLSWEAVGGDPCQASVPAERFRGEYFSNRDFAGAPVLVRDDGGAGLDFDWGSGSPGSACSVPADGFSARFTRTAAFESGTYRFTVTVDDGARLYVDGSLKLESWKDQAPTTYTVDVPLTAGNRTVRLDYYENAGGAVARLGWAKTGGSGPTSGSRLTIHTSFTGPLSMAFIRDAKPGLVKILDNFGPAAEIKSASPGTLIVGRIYEASQPSDGSPDERAQEWWARNRQRILDHPAVDYWEGYNEPGVDGVERIAWYARFEAERVRLLAQNGRKACIGNFSMGTPDVTNPSAWPAFYPAIDAARANGGILGLHEYGAPMQQYFDAASGEGWLCGRYRKVYRQFLGPAGRTLPLAITETGVDGDITGWKNGYTGEQYMDQLRWYDGILRTDSYVLGATVFSLEIPGWGSFDIAPIIGPFTDHVRQAR